MGRMTTSLRINDSNTKEVNLHYIPAEVHHDGKANIKSYFETSIQRPDTNSKYWFSRLTTVVDFLNCKETLMIKPLAKNWKKLENISFLSNEVNPHTSSSKAMPP